MYREGKKVVEKVITKVTKLQCIVVHSSNVIIVNEHHILTAKN